MEPLHITEPGVFLGRRSERLVQRVGKEVLSEHPLMDVEQVLVDSRAGSISWSLIEACSKRGIPITLLGWGGRPVARLTAPTLVATVRTRREQIAAYLDLRGGAVALAMAAGKLHNQVNTLRYFGKYRKAAHPGVYHAVEAEAAQIRALQREVRQLRPAPVDELRGAILNLEGRAGACYWRGVSLLLGDAMPLASREHRGTSDPANAMLNYGYGILQSQVWTALTLAGLEPFAGFLHVDRPGRASLVLDLMEEFRQPVVDRSLIAAVGRGMRVEMEEAPDEPDSDNSDGEEAAPGPRRFLITESRKEIGRKVLERLDSRETLYGQKHRLVNIIQMQARRLATALRGEGEYEAFTVSW